jgi:LysM domain
MRSSTIHLIAILTIGAVVAATSSASAGGFSFGGGKSGGGKGTGGKGSGGKGSGGSGFKINLGGGNHGKYDHHSHKHHQGYKHHHWYKDHHAYHYKYRLKPYRPAIVVYNKCYRPAYSYCFVSPGDTWYTIAKRSYGTSNVWKHIATYNRLRPSNTVLFPGQKLRLPVVNANGTLAASNAPAPPAFVPRGTRLAPPAQASMQQGSPAATGAGLPPVTIGSTLALDGASFGSERGVVRLQISGMALPVEVVEWSDSSVKIELPSMELTAAMKADLQVLRADGSRASSSAIQLLPSETRLALGN